MNKEYSMDKSLAFRFKNDKKQQTKRIKFISLFNYDSLIG